MEVSRTDSRMIELPGKNGEGLRVGIRNGAIRQMNYLNLASVLLAFTGGLVGLLAAWYWFKASRIPVDPGWRSGVPESAEDARKPIEPVDRELAQSLWITGILKAGGESAGLNKIAALLTAIAAALSAASSILGGLVGWVK